MKKIVIATKNQGKIREMMEAFEHLPVEVVSLADFGELPDAVEDEIAELVSLPVECSKNPRGSSVGQVIVEEGLDKLYIDHVIAAAPCKLNGLKVVMDCSNGANSVIAPVILRSLGVEVVTIFNQPNGININNGCGSTHLEALQAKVVEVGADVGIANDGDADRCLVVDEKGEALDGDQMMLICALELMKKKQGKEVLGVLLQR